MPDNTAGTVVTPNGLVDRLPTTLIEGGTSQGANLFQSFTDFNVDTGQRVYFANPAMVENILSRVTGGAVSDIDGLLGVNGDANLFLLNPNGVIFGPNARLDINGSFTTSTAGSFVFADGTEFRAIPQVGELFSASVPLGVQFNEPSNLPQGDITSTGILETGQDLSLAGDELYLEGQLQTGGNLTLLAEDTVTIRDTATDAFIANTGGDLTIQGNQEVDIWTLQHLEQTPFVSGGDLRLISDGVISGDAHFESGGSLLLLTLDGLPGNFVSFYDPIISANGDVVFGDYEGVALKVEATGSIQGGNIRITGPDTTIPIADNEPEDSDNRLLANSRALILRAGVDEIKAPNISQTTGGTTFTSETVIGQPAGSVVVGSITTSSSVSSEDGGTIIISSTNGNITTKALDSVALITNRGNIETAGNGGAIIISSTNGNITTGNLETRTLLLNVNRGSSVETAGNGGAITISSTNGNITTGNLETSASLANIGSVETAGNGGAITISSTNGNITTGNLETRTSFASVRNIDIKTVGNGGAITISSSGNITTGDLETGNLVDFFRNGERIETAGHGGAITISSSGNVETGNLNSFTDSSDNNNGDGGAITISSSGNVETGNLNSFTNSSNNNNGDGGAITISSSGNIETGNLNSSASSSGIIVLGNSGNGGVIKISSGGNIQTRNLNSSTVSFNNNNGDGGAILISSDGNIVTGGLSASTTTSFFGENTGNGGKIIISSGGNIEAENFDTSTSSTSSASSANTGDGGEIIISSGGNIEAENFDTSTSTDSSSRMYGINTGNGGKIIISSGGNIEAENFDTSTASRYGTTGNGGRIAISSNGSVETESLNTSADSSFGKNTGDGGKIIVYSNENIEIENVDSSSIVADANAGNSGNGGAIIISSEKGSIIFNNSSPINVNSSSYTFLNSASTELEDSSGNAGNISLLAPGGNILVASEANTVRISAVSIVGKGGDVELTARNSISNLDILTFSVTSDASSEVNIQGLGDLIVSNVNLITEVDEERFPFLFEENIEDSISSFSQSGDVIIRSNGSLTFDNSNVSSTTNTSQPAGIISITSAEEVSLINDSTINSDTQDAGNAGDINITANQVTVTKGSRISALASGSGQGGNLTVQNTSSLTIQGPGELSVGSTSENSGQAGTLEVSAPLLILDNDVRLLANSASTTGGGNINFKNVDDAIILRRGSLVSAESSNSAGGDGGNILIDTDFLITIPNENSDIIANASRGRGGRIEINANSILGLVERNNLTASDLNRLPTNDLSASSELGVQGDIVLNTLDVDPSQGLTELPADLTDRTNQVTKGCGIGNDNTQSEFVITGSGGLPPSPNDSATANQINVPWVAYTENTPTTISTADTSPTTTLVEAQQIVIDAEGNAYFVPHGNHNSEDTLIASGLPPTEQCAANLLSQH
ncbi:MAG: filamentous hemagglutinin N-terminal domain-containing protein [Cyanobacteria bacterium P01_H01_bin.21]